MKKLILCTLLSALMAHGATFYCIWEGTSFSNSTGFAPLLEKDMRAAGYTVYDNTSGGHSICNNLDCAFVTAISGSSVGTYTGGCEATAGTTVCRAPLIDDPYFGAHPGSYLIFWQDGPTNDVSPSAGFETTVYNRMTDLFNRRIASCVTSGSQCVFMTSTIVARGWATGSYTADELVRNNYNTLLRSLCSGTAIQTNANGGIQYRCANYSGYKFYLDDVAADSRLGVAGDENDTTYFNGDKVHLIRAGDDIRNALLETAFSDLASLPITTIAPLRGNFRR